MNKTDFFFFLAHHIFVGDLSSDVNDQMLFKAFQPYGSLAYVLMT